MPRQSIPLALSVTLALIAGHPSRAADAPSVAAPPPTAGAGKASAPAATAKLVDINKASRPELKSLPGIGEAEAARMIASRPYMTKTDLVTKHVLTMEAYDLLRSHIVVLHKGPPPKPKP